MERDNAVEALQIVSGGVVGMILAMSARASDEAAAPTIREDDRPASVDWGFGPGVRPKDTAVRAVQEMTGVPADAPAGGPEAQAKGVFGLPVAWPIIAIHTVLLPDGRVMNYGTDERGRQGAELVYDVWDPKLGTDAVAHTVLPNTTSTDIFCGAQSMMVASGEMLITGGDKAINGAQHFSDQATTIFNPLTNQIRSNSSMLYARWYPTIVALPTGEMLVVGGREDKLPDIPVPTPEVFTPNVGWRTLWGATSDAAFGSGRAACLKAASACPFEMPSGRPSKRSAMACTWTCAGVSRRHPGAMRAWVISFGPSLGTAQAQKAPPGAAWRFFACEAVGKSVSRRCQPLDTNFRENPGAARQPGFLIGPSRSSPLCGRSAELSTKAGSLQGYELSL